VVASVRSVAVRAFKPKNLSHKTNPVLQAQSLGFCLFFALTASQFALTFPESRFTTGRGFDANSAFVLRSVPLPENLFETTEAERSLLAAAACGACNRHF
jgi:hypothetical protein